MHLFYYQQGLFNDDSSPPSASSALTGGGSPTSSGASSPSFALSATLTPPSTPQERRRRQRQDSRHGAEPAGSALGRTKSGSGSSAAGDAVASVPSGSRHRATPPSGSPAEAPAPSFELVLHGEGKDLEDLVQDAAGAANASANIRALRARLAELQWRIETDSGVLRTEEETLESQKPPSQDDLVALQEEYESMRGRFHDQLRDLDRQLEAQQAAVAAAERRVICMEDLVHFHEEQRRLVAWHCKRLCREKVSQETLASQRLSQEEMKREHLELEAELREEERARARLRQEWVELKRVEVELRRKALGGEMGSLGAWGSWLLGITGTTTADADAAGGQAGPARVAAGKCAGAARDEEVAALAAAAAAGAATPAVSMGSRR